MTYRIAICDDEESIILILQKYIQKICQEEGMNVVVETYQNPMELIEKIIKKPTIYDLIFLDVDMPDINGIDVGKRIKGVNEYTLITFVTAHDQYALKAFEVGAFNYMMKPIKENKFKESLLKSLRFIHKIKREQEYITIQDKGKYIKIQYKDILFFEKHKNKVMILCEEYEYEAYLTFKKLKEMVGDELFVQCHRGAIVHKEKITRLENNMVILNKDHKIPVSKHYLKDMKDTFFESLRGDKFQ